MVTAGVYLLMRCSPILEQSPIAMLIITIAGATTSFVAASIGLFQNDIKKIIAYSTMSQLAQEYNKFIIFRYRTICVELIFFNICNSQITKAHNYIKYDYIRSSLFNSFSAKRQYFLIYVYKVMSEKWKIITISWLVGISEAIRLILVIHYIKCWIVQYYIVWISFIGNIEYFVKCKHILNLFLFHSFVRENKNKITTGLNGSSILTLIIDESPIPFRGMGDSIENLQTNSKFKNQIFFEWLAGVLDGDGYIHVSKKGKPTVQITMDIRDKQALFEIKHKLGGSIRTMGNANVLRYQLGHKKGLLTLIDGVNGLIRNPRRLVQMNQLCIKYDKNIEYPKPLTFNNAWLSGFIDADGSIYMNEKSGQVFLSATQKNKYLLDPLIDLYGGRVDLLGKNVDAFKYIVYRKNELFYLIDNYFNKYPLRTKKANRLQLVKQFYLVRISKNNKDVFKLNEWVLFKDKWTKFSD